MDLLRKIIVALLLAALAAQASAKTKTIYIAPDGDDHWSGTADEPLRSLSAALEQSRLIRRNGAGKVQILLRGGNYPLNEPLILTPEDSGLVIAAFHNERPVVTGQTPIRGWTVSRLNPNIWQTQIADVRNGNWIFHELFVNGQRKSRTRVPEQGFFRVIGTGVAGRPTELQFHTGDIKAEWARPGDVELIAYSAWAQSRNQIREVIAASNIVSLAGSALPNTAEANPRFYIENAPVALRPGQWHLDLHTGLLTYWPDAGEDVPHAAIAAPHLFDLVQIKGQPDRLAHDIVFQGITFADTDWQLDGGSDLDPQAAVERPGAVRAEFARDCAFERCTFERLGGYALELDRGCQQDRIVGNLMHDLGAGGIRIGEREINDAVPFPCGHHVVTDNHIYNIGLANAPGVGIFVLLSAQNRIAHNEVDHTFYTAVSVGWTWGFGATPCRDNIVEFNHLHDIGQGMLSDMGGVYTLGLQPGSIVRNNLIHDVNVFGYGGWGLYTDEGSTEIVLENNVVYRCQTAGFHQHYGLYNIIRNNIFAFNHDTQLMRTRLEPKTSFTFTDNIVYFNTGTLFGGNWGDDLKMDHNLYFDTRAANGNNQTQRDLANWQKRGHDVHSLMIDPLFVAPRHDDFRLQRNSPALRFGFRPIDLSGVGVRPGFRQH